MYFPLGLQLKLQSKQVFLLFYSMWLNGGGKKKHKAMIGNTAQLSNNVALNSNIFNFIIVIFCMKNDFFPSPLQTLCPDRDCSLIPWVYRITFYHPHNTFKKQNLERICIMFFTVILNDSFLKKI